MKNELNTLTAFIGACATEIIRRNEQDRKDAGIITHQEAESTKNRLMRISEMATEAREGIVREFGVMSDCCGSAVIKSHLGDDICADCLEACDKVEINDSQSQASTEKVFRQKGTIK